MAEFHPSVWMYDDDFSKVYYRYFNDAAIVKNESSYAEREASEAETFVTWYHALSEVVQALLNQGLTLEHFGEYDYSTFDCFKYTVEFEKRKFRIAH